jgi:hypothetical protein
MGRLDGNDVNLNLVGRTIRKDSGDDEPVVLRVWRVMA